MTHRRMWWAATVAALVVLVLSVVTSLGAPSVGARPAHWGWSSDTWSAHVRRAPTPTPSPSPTASPTAQPAASPPPLLPPPPGASALSMYPFNAAATTVSTDGAMTSTTSGTAYKGLPVQTPGSGTKTGWIEFQWSLDGGTVNTSGLASSIGSPDAHGYLYDSTALEGQQFVAGNWSTTEQLWLPTGVTATVTERVYVRHSDGTYTAITSLTSGSITGNSGYQSASASSTTSTATSFATGDKPYMDA